MKKAFLILGSTVLTAIFVSPAVLAVQNFPLGDIAQSPEYVAPAYHQPKAETDAFPLNFEDQPPMVPHTTSKYQVTKNVNQCLKCHSPENAKITGSTEISATHFIDRDGKRTKNPSPRRYFCLQCHVSQSDVEPIVPNEFKPMSGYGK